MISLVLIFFVISLFVIYYILNTRSSIDHFMMFNIPTRYVCPTRNQTFDMRGEGAQIHRTEWPINNSEFGPYDPLICTGKRLS